jgi:ComF family protein
LGRKLGNLLHYSLLEDITEIKIFSEGSPIYIIPVPITRMKKNIRGYNQSEVIAGGFCEEDKNNIFQIQNNIIYKKINTIPQAKIPNRNERLKNIRGSFEIRNQNLISGKTILVIDDVTTTGATMQEIIKVLKKYGAKKVIGFAVAH